MTAIIGVMNIISTAIVPSIGNSIVTESVDKNYNDMNKFNFIYMWISGWCTICLALFISTFHENMDGGRIYVFIIFL